MTYLQSLFPAARQLELVEAMRAAFPDELMMHLEFQRVGGQVTCSGLPVIRFTTPERLAEIVAHHEQCGVLIANPHFYTLGRRRWAQARGREPTGDEGGDGPVCAAQPR